MAAQDHEMARPTEPKTAYPSEELVGDPGHVAPQIQYSQQLQEKVWFDLDDRLFMYVTRPFTSGLEASSY